MTLCGHGFTAMSKFGITNHRHGVLTAIFTLLVSAAASADMTAASILARTKILASDEFEGRAPGSAGEEKTVKYLVEELKNLGLAPGNPDGSYIQAVPLVGITSSPTLAFTINGSQQCPRTDQ